MDLLRSMQIFECVADSKSYTSAAHHLNMSTGAVSRHISELEQHLRTRLFHRTTRRIALTSAGNRYLARCKSILETLNEAEAEARAIHLRPSGCLRVHASQSLAQHYLVPALKSYREQHPSVQIGLTLSDAPIDLLNSEFDIAIMAVEALRDSSLVCTRLGDAHSVLCAAPHYIHSLQEIHSLPDVSRHTFIYLTPQWSENAELIAHGPDCRETLVVKPDMCISSLYSMVTALELGMGVGLLPMRAAVDAFRHGRLAHVLPGYQFERVGIYAVFASRLFLDAKVRTWLEHLKISFADCGNDHRSSPRPMIARHECALDVA
ncbi:LysR family transcriptional regulator [Paraburkholderia elongata]|uniref:LysR family transcriptional regulator n=1 Tax=Paraburkholderia elongata TaxID=2675747 RepID=A0A972NS80_9BURK|nr:LysR family transcriptional regulator [Paraburkholderia elongata]NPT56882.1 LysR family transcriptional regulator [Paraburkholderia elongata]